MKRMIKNHRKFATKKHGGSGIIPGGRTQQNYAELFNQYCKLAERGDAWGQFELGMMFFYGQGVPQSDHEAALWFRKAAEQGHAEAQAALVICTPLQQRTRLGLTTVSIRQEGWEARDRYLHCGGK
jgi:TPR repeat protein